MSQLRSRIQRLETQIGLVGRGSLDAFIQELERMGRNTSVPFGDAALELVKCLDDQELNSIIAEAETVWPEVARQELARIETGTIANL